MEQITINLTFYGSLKNYFGQKQQVKVLQETDLTSLLHFLKEIEPEATAILDSCRLAIDSEFETNEFKIVKPVEVVVMPPFSGG